MHKRVNNYFLTPTSFIEVGQTQCFTHCNQKYGAMLQAIEFLNMELFLTWNSQVGSGNCFNARELYFVQESFSFQQNTWCDLISSSNLGMYDEAQT